MQWGFERLLLFSDFGLLESLLPLPFLTSVRDIDIIPLVTVLPFYRFPFPSKTYRTSSFPPQKSLLSVP